MFGSHKCHSLLKMFQTLSSHTLPQFFMSNYITLWLIASLVWNPSNYTTMLHKLSSLLISVSPSIKRGILQIFWLPTLIGCITIPDLEWIFDNGISSSIFLVGVIWYIQGLFILSHVLWTTLEKPPPWPDPALLVFDHVGTAIPWGYSLRSGLYIYQNNHSGCCNKCWISHYTPMYGCSFPIASQRQKTGCNQPL